MILNNKPLIIYAIVFAICSIVFLTYPQIDLVVSGLFWESGKGFVYENSFLPVLLYQLILKMTKGVGLFLIIAGITKIIHKPLFNIKTNVIMFLLVSLILAPGIIANTLLKDNWGRARPSQVQEFGGTAHFSPPLLVAHECDKNCSFIAGHASMAFYTFSFALLVKNRNKRRLACVIAIMFGLLSGFGRIVQGGHFLSDVLFAGLIICGVIKVLHYVIIEKRQCASPQTA
jgi:lipid A 4'-phosphatase